MARHPSSFQELQRSGLVASSFWVTLLRYRPVLLIGLLWLVLICLAATAYSRLTSTGTPPVQMSPDLAAATPRSGSAPPTPRQQSVPTPEFSTRAVPTPSEPLPTFDEATVTPAAIEDGDGPLVPAWSLGLLVALCALGCFGITHGNRWTGPARTPKSRQPKKPASKQRRRSAPHPAKLKPYSPQRDGVLIPGQPPVVGDASRAPTAVPSNPPAPSTSEESKVEVMPEQANHPLDWPEDSLADTLDLRQRRSLSSFL